MTSPDAPRHIEIKDGDQTVAAAESLERLRERTGDTVTRSAGSTVLVDADIPGRASRD